MRDRSRTPSTGTRRIVLPARQTIGMSARPVRLDSTKSTSHRPRTRGASHPEWTRPRSDGPSTHKANRAGSNATKPAHRCRSGSAPTARASRQTAVRALPSCHLCLTARKCKLSPYFLKNTRYPMSLRDVGDHLRKRRLDLSLKQEDVASLLGANPSTYRVWEILRSRPAAKFRLK